MHRTGLLRSLTVVLWVTVPAASLRGDEPRLRLPDLAPVMLDLTNRGLPSPEEWRILHDDDRGGPLGSIADFHSNTVSFLGTRYHTVNAPEGTLASYGKIDADHRYDRYGLIQGVEFSHEEKEEDHRIK